jgi:NADPH2 dehydrogenase
VNRTVRYPRVSSFKSAEAFRAHIKTLDIEMGCDEEILKGSTSPLAQPYALDNFSIGNRFAIHPMEGWDGGTDGLPSDLTKRRWRNFGLSGAKLIWGGEAFAVVEEGRANPNQLMARPETKASMAELRDILLAAHAEVMDSTDDLLLGLQLTHSGRFCRPFRKDRMEPAILYHHPLLDAKFGLDESYPLMEDSYIEELVGHYINAAKIAWDVGYQFVDVKHCHGYLGHEFLSAYHRDGKYGGSFENRTRFAREIIEGIHAEAPGLQIGVRLSAFDSVPFKPDPDGGDERFLGAGIPEAYGDAMPYEYGFGLDPQDPLRMELGETEDFIEMLQGMGVRLINISCGSPYYNPHIQRPALFPPSDGYQPPEDPLVGVARQLNAVAAIKERFPNMAMVGSGYSYLQEFLPHVAQHYVREGKVDFPGLGRMVLSYPELPLDVLREGKMQRKLICRTFSDCTTAPRNGMVSGCFPLDGFYKAREEAQRLKELKAGAQ